MWYKSNVLISYFPHQIYRYRERERESLVRHVTAFPRPGTRGLRIHLRTFAEPVKKFVELKVR